MISKLKPHAPVIITAVLVSALMAGGPALAQAVDRVVNADKVDGKHAVGAGASSTARAGKLVATDRNGKLPNNIIAKAPDSARIGGRTLASLGSTVLSRTNTVSLSTGHNYLCSTETVEVTRPSLALVDYGTSFLGGAGGADVSTMPVVSNDGEASWEVFREGFGQSSTTAAANDWGSTGSSAPLELEAGASYSFAIRSNLFAGVAAGSGTCSLTVQIMPLGPNTFLPTWPN